MGFSEAVARSVLVKCGRSCCLCHSFCGSRIELHHIVQKIDGGDDSETNCIALCFNCHADVGAYNIRHPKGRRFTVSELRGHRDAWFRKIALSPGLPDDDEFRELDFKLFRRLWLWLGTPAVQEFLDKHHFGASFHESERQPISDFYRWSQRPEFEFFDADLERRRVGLVKRTGKFLSKLSLFTGPLGIQPDVYGIHPEVRNKFPQRWRREVAILNGRATQMFEELCEFARYARRKLRFDFDDLGLEL